MSDLNEEQSATAAEYVLGLLDPAARAQTAARIATDSSFAREVDAWEARFGPLLNSADEPPPAAVWVRISNSLAPATGQDRAPAGLRLWQGISALSTGVAATLAFILTTQSPPVPPVRPAAMMAALASGTTGAAAAAVSYDPASGTLILMPVAMDMPEHVPELWLIAADGIPHSLGVIKATDPSRMTVSPALKAMLAEGVTIAITPEKIGGSRDGKPSAAPIASGKITAI